jgi:3,4-dihydroxy 2-butanone 4-phosphate synthase/GTP cyclohydrolase II
LQISEVDFPNEFGKFKLSLYEESIDKLHHLAIFKGEINPNKPVLVRVHSECLTGDVFGSARCDCGDQKDEAMRMIEKYGNGVLLYLRQEGRGIGLKHKIRAYKLQDNGFDTVEANHELGFKADLREYGIGAQILKDLGVKKMRLITNNPQKIIGLSGYDLEVVERIPLIIPIKKNNKKYMQTKKAKMGHLI